MEYSQYTWVFALSVITGFFTSFGIGANDLANSFGTSVGTKALKLYQAVFIAFFCEIGGAVLLGAGVTSTIKSGVADPKAFTDTPDQLMWGMFCAMIAAAFWDNMACQLEMPVSTTHTTVGAIIGMTLVSKGGGAVVWNAKTDSFPFRKGFIVIVMSWFFSPIAAGIAVAIMYGLVRWLILRARNSFVRAFYALPLFVAATVAVIVAFIIQVGNKNDTWSTVPDGKVAWITIVCALGAAALTAVLVMPVLRRRADAAFEIEKKKVEREAALDALEQAHSHGKQQAIDDAKAALQALDAEEPEEPSRFEKWWAGVYDSKGGKLLLQNPVAKLLSHGVSHDIHEDVATDAKVQEIWANAEKFDFRTERLFRYLQVFSAMVMSFAHGSNDVANAMGPFSTVFYIWQNGKVPGSKVGVPEWILAYGGFGIAAGLAVFGHKIIKVLGVKAVKLTNARGFCAELCTALVVVVCSRFGLPVSTTQVCCGAIFAIGLFEGSKGVNWKLVIKTFFGWVITSVVAAFVCAAFTSFGLFSPNKAASNDAVWLVNSINTQTYDMIQQLNASATATNNLALEQQLAAYNATLTSVWQPQGVWADPTAAQSLNGEVMQLFTATTAA